MNTSAGAQLWDRLAHAGIAKGGCPAQGDVQSPWFVRVMLGFAGWLGALFLLLFIGISLSFLIENYAASAVVGAGLCATAAFILRTFRRNDFANQFALAVSFAGQALFLFGVMESLHWDSERYFVMALFEAILALVMESAIHRTVSAFAAAVALGHTLTSLDIGHIAPAVTLAMAAFTWRKELAWARWGKRVRPIGYGLTLAAFYANGMVIANGHAVFPSDHGVTELEMLFYGFGVLLNGAVFLVVIWRLLEKEGIHLGDRRAHVALGVSLALAALSFNALGITAGLTILLLGHANGNRLLSGLGVAASVAYLSHYYYQLDLNLLMKSFVLISTGLTLLIGRSLLVRLGVKEARKEVGDA